MTLLSDSDYEKIVKLKSHFGSLKNDIETIEGAFVIMKQVMESAIACFDNNVTTEYRRPGKTLYYLNLDTLGLFRLLPKIKEKAWEAKKTFIKKLDVETD